MKAIQSKSRVSMNDRWLRSLDDTGRRKEYSDAVQMGLRLRAGAQGERTFLLKARGRDGRMATVTLGTYPMLSLKDARQKAMACLLALKNGDDPNAEKRELRRKAAASSVTLADLLDEFEAFRAPRCKTWRRSPKGRSEARRRIDSVFGTLANQPVEDITEDDLVRCMMGHCPRRETGKPTANGQVSRARAYLAPVFAWAAQRKPFGRTGAGRPARLETVDVLRTFDPASDDPTILGRRERALSQAELQRLLPLLVHPAPARLRMRLTPESDYRPIALRFQLLTGARIDEVASMRWGDIARENGIWHKREIKSVGEKVSRAQFLELSREAMRLLRALPRHGVAARDELVFPNDADGKLGNWTRITRALQRESGTTGWQRHDLRRTAASIMRAVGVTEAVIDEILGHKVASSREGVSAALAHYIVPMEIQIDLPHPQRDALDLLARTLAAFQQVGKPVTVPADIAAVSERGQHNLERQPRKLPA